MLPSLKVIKIGLRRTTEALAAELAQPNPSRPTWSALEWQLAVAAAAAHGVSPLLCQICSWENPIWRSFLQSQRAHVALRYARISSLLDRIDAGARSRRLAMVPLKGSALHALGIYRPGERPMADIDLLVAPGDAPAAIALLEELGYQLSFTTRKHYVFKPVAARPSAGLGEHRDNQISIELHTRICEWLPVSPVDITRRIYPREPQSGLNPYPSTGALMSHLLLHTAGNIRSRSLRLLHLCDIARLAMRMAESDWNVLWDEPGSEAPWWALPPLCLTARYFPNAVPESVLTRLAGECPPLLRLISRQQTVTDVSCSALWIQAFGGIEWSRSMREAGQFVRNRIIPDTHSAKERADSIQAQPWMQGPGGIRLQRRRLMLARLAGPVPRADAMHAVSAALTQMASTPRT